MRKILEPQWAIAEERYPVIKSYIESYTNHYDIYGDSDGTVLRKTICST